MPVLKCLKCPYKRNASTWNSYAWGTVEPISTWTVICSWQTWTIFWNFQQGERREALFFCWAPHLPSDFIWNVFARGNWNTDPSERECLKFLVGIVKHNDNSWVNKELTDLEQTPRDYNHFRSAFVLMSWSLTRDEPLDLLSWNVFANDPQNQTQLALITQTKPKALRVLSEKCLMDDAPAFKMRARGSQIELKRKTSLLPSPFFSFLNWKRHQEVEGILNEWATFSKFNGTRPDKPELPTFINPRQRKYD